MLKAKSRVKVRAREDLTKEFGLSLAGYPKTEIYFNDKGEMDHVFGKEGIVKTIKGNNFNKGMICIHFDGDKEVSPWAYSRDMLVEIN